MKRASYREGIDIIANNDEPDDLDVESVGSFMTVKLLAWLFDVEPARVASDVIRYRKKHKETKS